jgi:hypothetical protein
LTIVPSALTVFFLPHGILPTFLVQLGGKMVELDVDVVDAPLDYNLLLGHNWTYAMNGVVSFVFRTLCFPHNWKIMTIMMIDQLSFAYVIPNASVGPSIPMVDNSQPKTENTSVRMYSSLMGNFDFMSLIHHVYAMSSRPVSSERYVPFRASYFNDPWSLPSFTTSYEGQSHDGMSMPLSTSKITYQVVLDSFSNLDLITSQTDKEDPILKPMWATSSSCSHDILDETLPSDEAIIEAMNGSDKPWHDMHHFSYFLP